MTNLLQLVKQDLRNSGIDDETAALNFQPIEAEDTFETMYPDARQLNNGTMPRRWALKFHKVEDFIGWICNGRIRHLGGSPYRDKDGDEMKYMSPYGHITPITFIEPGGRAIALVEARFGLAKPQGMGFWEWVRIYGLPIVLIEGEKKAASLICAGIPAIALPGIYTGYSTIKDEWQNVVDRQLREELEPYDTAGRSICIMFDYRPEADFEETVEFKAAAITSRRFKRATVKIAELPGPHKGADDYLVAGEFQVVDRAIETAKGASSYEQTRLWKEYREFTATGKKTEDFFFSAPEPENSTITIVKSNLNSGKSEWVGNTIPKVKKVKKGDKTVNKATADGVEVSLGHRNSLQEQLCNRWDFDHLDLHNAYGRFKDPNLRVALCFDSLLKLPPEIFVGATVIIDESMTAIKHLLCSSTLRGKRLEIIQRFSYIVKVCSRIILLDGNMSDWMGEYIASIDDTKKIVKYDNESQRPTPPIYFVEPGSLTKRKADEWINLQILQSRLPAVVVDSIVKAEAVAQQLQKLKGDGLLITSKTVTEKWVRDFLAAPDQYIDKNPYRVNWIVCTPTVESGVSIENVGKFDTLFCWFVGVVGINEAVQMSRRVRNPERILVYAPKTGINHKRNAGAFEQVILEDLALRITAEAGTFAGTLGDKVVATLKAQLDSPHVIAWGKMQAIEYLENRNYAEFLFLAFESMGMKPIRVQASEINSEAYREAKLEVQLAECTQIFNAIDLTEAQAEALGKKLDSTWEERCSILKFNLLHRFPGLENSPLWSVDFIHRIRYRERALSTQLELFWLLVHPDESEALKAQQWADKHDVDFFIPDRVQGDKWLFTKVLTKLKLTAFLDGHSYSDQSADVIEFVRAVRWQKTVSRVVGHPGTLTNLGFINRELMPILGIRPIKKQIRLPAPAVGVEGKRLWTYKYDPVESHPENWAELMGYVDRRFRLRLGQEISEEIPQNINENPSKLDSESVSEVDGIEDIHQKQIEAFEDIRSLEHSDIAQVMTCTNILQQTDNGVTIEGNYSQNEGIDGRSAASVVDAAIEGDRAIGTLMVEEPHKCNDREFLTVWVQTNHADRPKVEQAWLLDCINDGFKCQIDCEIWEIPAGNLDWSPPAPS